MSAAYAGLEAVELIVDQVYLKTPLPCPKSLESLFGILPNFIIDGIWVVGIS